MKKKGDIKLNIFKLEFWSRNNNPIFLGRYSSFIFFISPHLNYVRKFFIRKIINYKL